MTTTQFADIAPPLDAFEANLRASQVCATLGWSVVPWRYVTKGERQEKVPAIAGWTRGRAFTDVEEVAAWFLSAPDTYAGILTGPESGVFIVDIDPRNGGVETINALVAEHGPLPPTFTVRTPSGGWHAYFRYPADGRKVITRGNSLGPGVDIKGAGGFAAAPGAATSRGRYEPPDSAPLADAPAWLLDQATRVEDREWGTGTPWDSAGGAQSAPANVGAWLDGAAAVEGGRQDEYLRDLIMWLRCRNVGPDEMRDLGWRAASAFTNTRPAEPWTVADVEAKVTRVWHRYPFGALDSDVEVTPDMTAAVSGIIESHRNGDAAPVTGGSLPLTLSLRRTFPPGMPAAVARDMIRLLSDRGVRLVRWRDTWFFNHAGTGGRYQRVPEADDRTVIADLVRNALEHAVFVVPAGEGEEPTEKPWNPTTRSVNEVVAAVETFTRLPGDVGDGSWIDPRLEDALPSRELIVCRNGTLHVPPAGERQLYEHDTRFFTEVALDLDYNPLAPLPATWLRFLDQLWPGDPDSIATLQEWFGYVLSGETNLHKILLLVGPPRAGKGTIIWVLTRLLGGEGRVAHPTLKSLGGEFGLAPLLGKRLAVIGDARVGSDTKPLVETLLTVSGEDPVDVNRKHKPHLSGVRLGVRFIILTNEAPSLRDASGAMPNRFVPLRLAVSFLGREDTTLRDRLAPELAGILNWGLDGLDRLRRRGAFTLSAASSQLLADVAEAASPVAQFLTECCRVGDPALAVPRDTLWAAWSGWAVANGHHPGSKSTFGIQLRAAYPDIADARPGSKGQQVRVYTGITLNPVTYPG